MSTYILIADSEEKAIIIGFIFSAAIHNLVDNKTMLRLCTLVNRAFLPDLSFLPNYVEISHEGSIEAESFINLGLIDNPIISVWANDTTYQLNDTGIVLYKILMNNNWFK